MKILIIFILATIALAAVEQDIIPRVPVWIFFYLGLSLIIQYFCLFWLFRCKKC